MTERVDPTDVVVRDATVDDWPAIWAIFRDVVAGGDTYSYPPDIGEAEARATWMPDAAIGRRTHVAEVDGSIVGTAYVKPNQPGLGDHVANAGWMVDPVQAGRGIGRPFAEQVIARARADGFTAMQFNAVVATNTAAIALWRSLGFDEVGRIPGAFRHATEGEVDLLVMHRRLD